MSSVKIYLPVYNDKILLKLINLMNMYPLLKVINLLDLKNGGGDDKRWYNNICKLIFANYNKKLVLLGPGPKYELPIPTNIKIIFNKKLQSKYPSYLYVPIDRLLYMMKGRICDSSSTATFGYKKGFIGDTYNLWYQTTFNKIYVLNRNRLIKRIFNLDDEKDFENIELWEKTSIKNLKRYKDDYRRVLKANMNYPIIITREYKLCDGAHRLVKAYCNNIPKVKVKFVTKSQLDKVRIKNYVKFNKTIRERCKK